MTQDILITPGSGEPQILFRGSGTNDTPIELNVLSSYQSATGSGTALVFEGQEGQLFAVTDNLSSGTIFSVGDITGLSMLSVDASGDVKLGEFANSVIVYPGLTLDDNVPSTTSNVLYNDGGDLMWNGVTVIQSGAAQAVDGSGTASYVARFTDTNTLGTGIIYDNGTNVGIGTTSPTEKLEVNGNIRLSDATPARRLQFYRGGGTPYDYTISKEGTSLAISSANDPNTNRHIQFGHHNAGTWTPKVSINGYTGDLGIGTTSPSQTVDIRYPAGGGMALLKSTDSNDGLLFGDMAYSVSNTQQGIKHVAMTGIYDYMMMSDGLTTYISSKSNGGEVYLRAGGSNTASQIRLTSTEVSVNDYGSNLDFRVESNNDVNALFVDGVTDYVGIGVSNPSYKLDTGLNSIVRVGRHILKSQAIFLANSTDYYIGTLDTNSNGDSATIEMTVRTTGTVNTWRKIQFQLKNQSGTNTGFNYSIYGGSGDINLSLKYINRSGDASKTDIFISTDASASYGYTSFVSVTCPTSTYSSSFIEDTGYSATGATSVDLDANLALALTSTGSVGIGTGSPSSKLSVVDTGTSNIPVVKLDVTGTASYVHSQQALAPNITAGQAVVNFIGRAASSKNAGYIGYLYSGSAGSDDNKLTFGHWSSNHLMVLDGAGKLGIGTTSPSSKLHVQGSSDQLRLSDGTLAFTVGYDNNYLRFKTSAGDTPVVVNWNTGNVGIGTTSPSEKLHVIGEGLFLSEGTKTSKIVGTDSSLEVENALSIFRGTSNFGWLITSDPNNWFGIYNWNRNGYVFRIDDNTVVNAFNIKNNGSIGIGTTWPSQKLHIDEGNIRIEKTTDPTIEFNNGSANRASMFYDTSEETFVLNHTDADTNQLVLTSGNNVGIGTNDPNATLHVYSAASGDNIFNVEGTNGSLFGVTDNLSGVLMSVNTIAGLPVLEVNSDYSVTAGRFNQNDFVISSGGNVGIGTASPVHKLQVEGNVASEGLYLKQSDSSYRLISSNSINDVLFNGLHIKANYSVGVNGQRGSTLGMSYTGNDLGLYTASNERIRITSGGNVGIGETSPSQKLHVAGNLRLTGAFYDSNNAAGTSGQVLSSTATGTDWISLSEIQGVDGTGSAGQVAFWSDTDTITGESNLYWDSTNNRLGIGTNLPSESLHVLGTIKIGNWNTGGRILDISAGLGSIASPSFGYLRFTGYNEGIKSQIVGTDVAQNRAWGTLGFYTNGDDGLVERMHITKDGNVGIGTGSPSYPLVVDGRTQIVNDILDISDSGRLLIGGGGENENAISVRNDANKKIFTVDSVNENIEVDGDIYSSGNVAIGTDAAIAKLSVRGENNSEVISVGNNAGSAGPVTGNTRIGISHWNTLGTDSAHDYSPIQLEVEEISSADYRSDFFIRTRGANSDSEPTRRLVVKSDGDVGIGTDSPSEKLHVMGGTRLQGDSTNTTWTSASPTLAIKRASSSPYISFHADTGGRLGYLQFNSSNVNRLNVETYNDLIIHTNGLERMTVSKDGYVNFSNYLRIDKSTDDRGIVFEDGGGDDTIYMTVNDGQGNFNIMLGVNHSGNRILTGDGLSKILLSGHGRQGEISLNAGQTGTAGASAVYNIGLSVDSTDQKLRIGNPNDNIGLDDQAGNIIADVDGDLITRYLRARDANGIQIGDDSDTLGIFVKDGGNVGIGTASPNEQLSIGYADASSAKIEFRSASYARQAMIEGIDGQSSGDGHLAFHTRKIGNALERLRITADGNVGIGTTSPAAKLDVNGSARIDSTSAVPAGCKLLVGNVLEAGSTAPVQIGGLVRVQSGVVIHDSTTVGRQFYLNHVAADGLRIYRNAGTGSQNILLAEQGGNVGIGTTSPINKLQIGTTTSTGTSSPVTLSLGGTYSSTAGANPKFKLYQDSSNNTYGFGVSSNSLDYIAPISANSHNFYVGGSHSVRITQTSLGIGTTNPQQELHVVGDQRIENATDPKLEFHDGAAVGGYVKFDTSEDNLVLSHVDVAGDNQIALANDGNVGIGTASPNAVLHAYGSTPSGTVFNVEGTNGSLFSVVDNLSGVLMSVNNNAGLPVFEVNDDDSIIAGRFAQDDFVITSSGDIGMGTATPVSKLDVSGVITATGGNSTQWNAAYDWVAASGASAGGGSPNNGTLTMNTSGTGLSGSATFTADQSGNSTFTVASNATSANTVSTIVARDSSGNFSAGTITATQVNVDNLRLDGNTLSSTNSNGNVIITPNGTGGIAAGTSPTVTGPYATVGGGYGNTASGFSSTVSGGYFNTASGYGATVAGGSNPLLAGGYNTACGVGSTISGGYGNNASGNSSTISGGGSNTASNYNSTVGGGNSNTASGFYSTVSGGYSNCASGCCSTVGGGYGNCATGYGSTIGGGGGLLYGFFNCGNTASGCYSTVGGGAGNTASQYSSTVGGGYKNCATASCSTVGGGRQNTASGQNSTISGGGAGNATGNGSVISGGFLNFATGNYSTVSGGYSTKATRYGEVAHAAGRFAQPGDAQHSTFVARKNTTNATANVELFLDGSAQRMTLTAETTWTFDIKLSAYNDTDNTTAWWIIRGGIRRDAANNTSLIGSLIEERDYEGTMSGTSAAVTADDTNESLKIAVTGLASKNIRWVAVVDVAQVSWGTP
jgi:hypothetical protein